MDAVQILKQLKYARIIKAYAEQYGTTYQEAMDLLFHSVTLQLIEEGVADMHCRSDLYLVDELHLEMNKLA